MTASPRAIAPLVLRSPVVVVVAAAVAVGVAGAAAAAVLMVAVVWAVAAVASCSPQFPLHERHCPPPLQSNHLAARHHRYCAIPHHWRLRLLCPVEEVLACAKTTGSVTLVQGNKGRATRGANPRGQGRKKCGLLVAGSSTGLLLWTAAQL